MRPFLVALVVLATGGSAHAAPTTWVGVNDISAFRGAVPFDTAARAAADMGASSARFVVDWSWIEATKGVFTWGTVDAAYRADLAHGLRPLIGITGAPRWAWARSARCPAGRSCAYPPGRAHDADYAAMVRRLAARYPRAVAIEVGNEPNLAWAWAGGVNPRRYTQLLALAYRAVKSVDAAMPVLSGGLAPVLTEARGRRAFGLRPFLQAMYDNGARGHMDGISVHPYAHGVDFSDSFAALSIVKETRSANGDSVPLWATEIGMSTTEFSPADQGTALPALYDALRADPEVRGVYVHTLYDEPANPTPAERGYGLLAADGTPKPAYCGLAAANGSSWRCPPSVAAVATAAQAKRWTAQALLQAAADAARRIHLATGSYRAVTPAALHAQDPRLSAAPAVGRLLPRANAEPSRIGVFALAGDGLVLCNASEAGRSYCLATVWQRRWTYASSPGTLFAAAGALLKGRSARW